MHALFRNLFSLLDLFLLEFANLFSATNSQKVEETKWIILHSSPLPKINMASCYTP